MRPLAHIFLLLAVACLTLAACVGQKRVVSIAEPSGDVTSDAFRQLDGGFGIWLSAKSARQQASTPEAAAAFADFLHAAGVRLVMVESRTPADEVTFPSYTYRALDDDEGLLQRLLESNRARGIETVAVLPLFLGIPQEGEAPIEARLDATGQVALAERVGPFPPPALPYRTLFAESVRHRTMLVLEEIARVEGLSSVCLSHAGFSGHRSDFHGDARRAFEQFLGAAVPNWPESILSAEGEEDQRRLAPGPLWNAWSRWRTRVVSALLFQFTVRLREELDLEFGRPLEVGLMASGYLDQRIRTGVNWVSVQDPADPGVAELFDRLYLEAYAPVVTRAAAREAGLQESASLEAVLEAARQSVPDTVEIWIVLSVIPYLNEAGQLGTDGRRQLRAALRMAREQRVPVVVMDYEMIRRGTAWEDIRAALTMP